MSGTLNTTFMKDPEGFLREFALAVSIELKKKTALLPDAYEFDLQPADLPKFALLALAGPESDPGEKFVRAYWLPWKPKETTEIVFNKGSRNPIQYFFTSDLEGCRLQIVPAEGGTHLKVLHIAGNKGEGAEGTEWREQEAGKNLTKYERVRSRAFSSTVQYPRGYAEPGEEGSNATVVGFRRNYRWEFWAQQTDDSGKVSRVWKIY